MPIAFRTRDQRSALDPADDQRLLGRDSEAIAEGPIRVALVNNMPDTALEDTEQQFVELLGAAACDLTVELSLFSIPTVPRGERAQTRLDEFYFGLPELLTSRFDGVIITGTEPRQPDLKQEPYWNDLAAVMDWAEQYSYSTILSCLAAHAGVLHSDGILRRRLDDKRFGVFVEAKLTDHPLTRSVDAPICFPHSRWNDLAAGELVAHGYTILTQAEHAGVGLFVKQKRASLFVHFQGHPEYSERTLLKEYRRDVRRYLLKERETYPSLPHGYFDSQAEDLLNGFRGQVLENRSEHWIQYFPADLAGETLLKTWHSSSVAIYNNWLRYVTARRAKADNVRVSMQAAGG
jgi:homoserine O-succinyltransferase/O-acetyltransferase